MTRISFSSLSKYKSLLEELEIHSELNAIDIDRIITNYSELEKSLLENTQKQGDVESKKVKEVIDRMNKVYFGYRARPDYAGIKHDKFTDKAVFNYFLKLIDDKPINHDLIPKEGITEGRKLYGAFAAYADYTGKGHDCMIRHRGNTELGKKIITRLNNGRHSSKDKNPYHTDTYLHHNFHYILAVYWPGIKRTNGKEMESLNADQQIKRFIIPEVKKFYNVK